MKLSVKNHQLDAMAKYIWRSCGLSRSAAIQFAICWQWCACGRTRACVHASVKAECDCSDVKVRRQSLAGNNKHNIAGFRRPLLVCTITKPQAFGAVCRDLTPGFCAERWLTWSQKGEVEKRMY